LYIITTGWPKVLVLTLSKDKVVLAFAAILSTFLFPILISCLLYVAMICIKKRQFQNRIDAATKTMETDKASYNLNSITDEFEDREHQAETENPDFMQNQLCTLGAQEVVSLLSSYTSKQLN
jgi:hypothetical protein